MGWSTWNMYLLALMQCKASKLSRQQARYQLVLSGCSPETHAALTKGGHRQQVPLSQQWSCQYLSRFALVSLR